MSGRDHGQRIGGDLSHEEREIAAVSRRGPIHPRAWSIPEAGPIGCDRPVLAGKATHEGAHLPTGGDRTQGWQEEYGRTSSGRGHPNFDRGALPGPAHHCGTRHRLVGCHRLTLSGDNGDRCFAPLSPFWPRQATAKLCFPLPFLGSEAEVGTMEIGRFCASATISAPVGLPSPIVFA